MKGRIAYLYKLPIIFTILFFIAPLDAFSKEPKIENLTITKDSKNLAISFNLKNSFSRDIEKALLSGMPTTFIFSFEIYRERPFWPDKKVASFKLSRVCKYNTLKEEFEIFQEESPESHLYVKEIDDVIEAMSVMKQIPVAPLFLFSNKDGSYKLRVKAELDTIELPFPFNYLLFFLHFWDFETSWAAERFSVENGLALTLPGN